MISQDLCVSAAVVKTNSVQIIAFMVLAIIGAVFAAIQLIIAADGADEVNRLFGEYVDSGHDDVSCFICTSITA